ncbi:MAG: sugar ABC transporter permease [Bacteroidota bacterium]|nr:sugar ABC transporter permease [Bacteroidota bacterium]MDP4233837.1 sugar ABC transporter permease [Bacteroidota bacterium]MDP4242464.1 sugar ABC transporter permease [Bacteroidota bacterium]MDP4289052.1 sugar ABC transporter permease [Bacteroidota bacterium]
MRTARTTRETWLLLSPWVLTLIVFWAYPLLYALYLSFTKYYTLTNRTVWIGLDNYGKLLHDPAFWQALWNTVIFVVGTIPFTMIFALFFAALLVRVERFQHFYRSVMFLPSITSLVVISLIFTNLYSSGGYINTLLKMAGVHTPANGWLLEPSLALPAIMAMDIWISIGYYAVLFLAAMQNVSRDYYEVAELEGTSKWKQFFTVTLPLIKPTLLFALVLNTIKSFQVFTEIYVMTRGGPLGKTTTLVYQVYSNAFESADTMGFACAVAYVLFAIIAIFSVVESRILKEAT